MYIQITNKCNMKCAHCCFACTSRGKFMSLDTFKAALKIASEYGECVTIGGGEPTLHPDFEKFLLLAIANQNEDESDKVFVVTNGSIKDRAMMLGKLSAANVIEAKLSWDQFHDLDMVDEEVYNWFESMGALWGPVYGTDPVRPTNKLSKRGRAKKIKEAQDDCACEDLFINPDGDVFQCGCPDSPKLGNVNEGYSFGGWVAHCCYHSEEYANETAG